MMKLKKRLQKNIVSKDENAEPKHLPLFSKVSFCLALACAFLFVGFIISERFADFFNENISSIFRAVSANITDILPFSLAEMALILAPAIVVFLVIYASHRYTDTWRDALVFCGAVVSVLALFFCSFTLSFAAAYRGTSLDRKLGIERKDVSAEELYETALILSERVNEESKLVAFEQGGFSVMPYGYGEMNDKLMFIDRNHYQMVVETLAPYVEEQGRLADSVAEQIAVRSCGNSDIIDCFADNSNIAGIVGRTEIYCSVMRY